MALEMLSEEIHKRPSATHIFVFLLLMTQLWRNNLGNYVDLMFTIPIGIVCWPNDCHESLLCSAILTILSRYPWKGPWVMSC